MILNRIKFLCEQNKISVKSIIETIGVTEAGFYGFFRNNTLKVRDLEKIAEVLNVPITYFFEVKSDETSTKTNNAMVVFELQNDDVLMLDMKKKKLEIIHKK